MSNLATASRDQAENVQRKDGLIGKTINWVLTLIVWLALALLINIIAELGGITLGWWDEPGAEHSYGMLKKELTWLNSDFKDVIGNPHEKASLMAKKTYDILFIWEGKDFARSLVVSETGKSINEYIKATITMIELFSVRLVVIVFSFPVFLIAAGIGLVDGLIQRDLRRFGGGRESSYFWHYVASWIKPLFIAPFVIYLASPFSIHPTWVMLPFAFSFGFAIWLSASTFKKYL